MIINSLRLHNFLSHEDTEISFEKGVNIIIGKNGAGKSSIIDGMKFAFLGERRGSKIEDLVKRGKNECSVSMDFTIGNHTYSVERRISLGRNGNVKDRDAVLLQDGTEVARHVSGVDKAIEDPNFVGINSEVFLNSVFVEQGEIDALVSSTKSDREKIFGKIVGLDVLTRYADDLRALKKDLDLEKAKLSGVTEELESASKEMEEAAGEKTRLEGDLERSEKEIESLKKDLEEATGNRDQLFGKIKKMEADMETLTKKRKKAKEMMSEIQRLNAEKQKASDDLKTLEDRIDRSLLENKDKIQSFITISRDIEVNSKNIKIMDDQIKRYSEMAAQLEGLKGSHERFNSLKEDLLNLQKQIEPLEGGWDKYRRNLDRAEGEKEKKESIEDSILREKGKIREILGVDIDNPEALSRYVLEIRSNFTNVQERRATIATRKKALEDQLTSLKSKIDSIAGLTRCPLCQQQITDEHRDMILSDYNSSKADIEKELNINGNEGGDVEIEYTKLKKIMNFLDSTIVTDLYNNMNNLKTSEEAHRRFLEEMKITEPDYTRYEELQRQKAAKTGDYEKMQNQENNYRALEMSLSGIDIESRQKERDGLVSTVERRQEEIQEIATELGFKPNNATLAKIREMEPIETKIREKNEQIRHAETLLESTKRSHSDEEEDIRELERSITELPTLSEELKKSDLRKSELQKQHDIALSRKSEINAKINVNKRQIETLDMGIKNLRLKRDKLKALSTAVVEVEKLRQCFDRDGIQRSIRKDSAEFLTTKVMDYADSFNLNFDDVRVSEDMNIEISQNGQMESIDMLSGGEKTALSIALRLALAKYVMENIKTMIMDEPTTYLDQDRRSNLKDIIQYTFSSEDSPVPQMIIVTHHNDLYTAADNVFEVVKQNGSSMVSSVI